MTHVLFSVFEFSLHIYKLEKRKKNKINKMCYVFITGSGISVLDDKYGIISYDIATVKLVCSLLYVLVNNFSVMLDLLTTFGFDWPRGFIDNL